MSYLVDVLLATYNGERFLQEQLDSLLKQTFTDWGLIVRDDGSKDKTLSILKKFQSEHPLKITILKDTQGRLGPAQSFAYLARESSAPYVAFCDQDDVWLQDKLFLQFEEMQKTEKKFGAAVPVLIHSDLYVIDTNKKLLDNSFWHYQNLNPQVMSKFRRLLVQNYVTGCTILSNRALLNHALPISDKAVMHDWWLALIALSEGKVIDLGVNTVQYRQHEKNDTGAKKWNVPLMLKAGFRERKKIKFNLLSTCVQAGALHESGKLNQTTEKIVAQYTNMFGLNWFYRRVEMVHMGFFKYGVVRNLAMFLLL